MKKKLNACELTFGDYDSYKPLSRKDIEIIISRAEKQRSLAVVESIKNFPLLFKIQKEDIDFPPIETNI